MLTDCDDQQCLYGAVGHWYNIQNTDDKWQEWKYLALPFLCRWIQ